MKVPKIGIQKDENHFMT